MWESWESALRLFVVTHCEARHHVESKVGGWFDTELTGLGVRQAKALGQHLQAKFGERDRSPQLFSSDLTRARETADHIAAAIGSDVRLRQELREQCLGVAEGEPQSWLQAHSEPVAKLGDVLHHKCADGAESVFEVSERVYPLVDGLAQREATDIVVVTHGGTHDVVVAAWLGLPQEALGRFSLQTGPAGITELGVHAELGTRVLVSLNDRQHLQQDAAFA